MWLNFADTEPMMHFMTKKVCLARHRRATRMGITLNSIKDKDKNEWYRSYLKVSRSFFNEDFEQANREARDAIAKITNSNTRELGLLTDFYLMGIDASVKMGNPDEDLLEQANRIAVNDPSIMLRKLLMKIYYFEISRNCDIRISDTIDEIEGIGIETESRIHESYRINKDLGVFKENVEYLEECYSRYM
jgi:hypothetical protein